MKSVSICLALLLSLSVANSVVWAAESEGYELFTDRCGLCHREAGTGTFMLERRLGVDLSILEERKNLTNEYISSVVRLGIGSMPRFSRGEVSDAELRLIREYLINAYKTTE